MTDTLEELERLMREALALVRLGPLTKHEHQELDSLMTRAINALPGLIESARRVEGLEAALKPFAEYGATLEGQQARGDVILCELWTHKITVEDMRYAARAALKGT